MVLEATLLLLNVFLCTVILYRILRPKPFERTLRDRLAEVYEHWKSHRRLHPKSPEACALCRGGQVQADQPRRPPVPYPQTKSNRGRKKQLDSRGKACLNPNCPYFMVTDAAVHALVGDGRRGRHHDIQHWLCQACGHRYTTRQGTVLYRLKTPAQVVEQALKLMCLGVSQADIADVVGVDEATVALWLERAGQHGQRLHDQFCTNQAPQVLQLDELYANLRGALKHVWVWFAIDPQTKLLLSLYVGSRKSAAAMAFIHDLVHRLRPGHLPVFLSDGLMAYYYALTAHVGFWRSSPRTARPVWVVASGFVYAQVVKVTRGRRLLAAFPRAIAGTLVQARHRLQLAGFSGKIHTALIERVNLTFRRGIAALARRTWATYHSPERLDIHLQLYRTYYHFVRPHASLTLGKQRRTPAMAAGWTDHRWTIAEWLAYSAYPG